MPDAVHYSIRTRHVLQQVSRLRRRTEGISYLWLGFYNLNFG